MKKLLLRLIYLWERMGNLITLRRKKVHFDKSIRIHGLMKIYGRGHITIGKNVLINSKESANPGMGCYPKFSASPPVRWKSALMWECPVYPFSARNGCVSAAMCFLGAV